MKLNEAKQILNKNGYLLTERDDIDEYWSCGGGSIHHLQKIDIETTKEFLEDLDVDKVETYAEVQEIDKYNAYWKCYMDIYIPKSNVEGLSNEEISDKYEVPLLEKLYIEYDDSNFEETDEFFVIKEEGRYKYSLD